MAQNDLHTEAIVLRRTKYGETDRILNFITPTGKLSVIAKGARKEKSKLAGGIEMFCVSEITVHYKNNHSSGLGILTSAKLKIFYSNILNSLEKLELASDIIKKISKLSEHIDSPELYTLTKSCFSAIHQTENQRLVEAWALLNLARISGDQINLHFDINGKPLSANQNYNWDTLERTLAPHDSGKITADHIKFLRLMLSTDLPTVLRVQNTNDLLDDILYIAKTCYN